MAEKLPGYFDRLLVDAPCSGEGMFRKDPDAVQYWNKDYPTECATRQRTILAAAVKNLRPGGELIYSTCTFAPEEDEQIISWLVTNYDFEILPVKKYPGMDSGIPEWADGNEALRNCVRIFPHHFKGEGHFIAKLRKLGNPVDKETRDRPVKISRNISDLSRDQQQLWQAFKKETLNSVSFGRLVSFKDDLYAVPEITPNLDGIKIVRLGLKLGTFKKKRFEPSYALALALKPGELKHTININDEDWAKYVHGDTFQVDRELMKGWYQIVCESLPVGFVKVVNGTAKNFFPKGLRFNV